MPTAAEILSQLTGVFPSFLNAWAGSPFNTRDEAPRYHAVLAAFSHYFRDSYASFSRAQLQQLAWALNGWFADPDSDLGNATATCFLENVAGEPCVQQLTPLLQESARKFMRGWGQTGA